MDKMSALDASRGGGVSNTTADFSSAPVAKHKLVLLGDQSVGKTSLVTRFMYDTFDQQYQTTVGIDFFSKTVHINNQTVRLHVWDTAGQERFRSLIPGYIRNSSGALVVYDVCSRQSFFSAFKWIDEVRAERGDDVVVVLVGNKSDAQEGRAVSAEEAQRKAEERGLVFMEVSAKLGTGVKALFRRVAETLPRQDNGDGAQDDSEGGARPAVLGKQRDPFLLTPSRADGAGDSGGAHGRCC